MNRVDSVYGPLRLRVCQSSFCPSSEGIGNGLDCPIKLKGLHYALSPPPINPLSSLYGPATASEREREKEREKKGRS
jgi:hypothetical protein